MKEEDDAPPAHREIVSGSHPYAAVRRRPLSGSCEAIEWLAGGGGAGTSSGSPKALLREGGVPLSGMSEEGAGKARRPTRPASIERGARDAQRIPREEPAPSTRSFVRSDDIPVSEGVSHGRVRERAGHYTL